MLTKYEANQSPSNIIKNQIAQEYLFQNLKPVSDRIRRQSIKIS
jgi:hypothetical protein